MTTANPNPLLQQRQILTEGALVRVESGAVAVSGPDRLTWLHTLLSQNIANLKPGESTSALLMDAQGHIEHLMHVTDDGETTWLITQTSGIAALVEALRKMVFRKQVTIQDRSDDFVVVVSWGQPLDAVPVVWAHPSASVSPGGHRYGAPADNPWLVFENLVPVDQMAQLQTSHVFASTAALDALRIAAYQASVAELDEKSLPHELELLANAVHLSKGCYRGQETVAKVHNLGHPPRRLVLLHLDGSEHELPAVGSSVFIVGMDKAPCGKVTSVAQHHEMGPIALAVVVRRTPEDAALVIQTEFGPVSATQEVIVPSSAGRTADVPKLPRLKLGARL